VVDAVDGANPTKGLYKVADGGFYVADDGLASGADLGDNAISLTSKGKVWSPGKANATALRVTDDGYQVLLRSGTDAKPSYSVQAFDATGASVGKESKLTTVGMFGAEVDFNQDFNGDAAVGDVIASVLDKEDAPQQAGTVGLYKLSSDRFAIDVARQLANSSTSNDVVYLTTSNGKSWTPGKVEPIAVRVTDGGYEVMMRTGSGSKTSYSVQGFDRDGVAIGKASKLTTIDMLNAEQNYMQDFNDDTKSGDVIASVVDSANAVGNDASYGLYKLTSNRYVVDVSGLVSDKATSKAAVFLTSKSAPWSPGKANALAVRSTEAGFEVLLKTGEGAKAKYTVEAFAASGEVSGKAKSLDPVGLIDAEKTFKQDFNGDTTLGDYVTTVLDGKDPTGTRGIYAMKSGGVSVGNANLAEGASSDSLVRLIDGSKVWGSGKQTAVAVALKEDSAGSTSTNIILKSGSGTTAKFSEVTFDSNGLLSVKATSLKAAVIPEKELAYDQDLDDDGKVGTSAFSIKVNFTGDEAYKSYFDSAAARWSEVILNDLPDATNQSYNWTNISGYEVLGNKDYGTIDDLLIEALMYDGGDSGILGSAGPLTSRSDGMPILGRMRFNTFYMSSMVNSKTFGDVILHEMGHVLGLGTRWSALKDGYDYKGSAAVKQYALMTGQAQTSVPVEQQGGAGTAGAHWAENIFKSELMTGFAENAPPMPLSKVTVGSLEDLGYTVSYAMADAFELGSQTSGASLASGANSSTWMHQMACRCMTCEVKQMSDGTIGVEIKVSTIAVVA
jgi:NAD/NADP transhydrogenase alpha subunit